MKRMSPAYNARRNRSTRFRNLPAFIVSYHYLPNDIRRTSRSLCLVTGKHLSRKVEPRLLLTENKLTASTGLTGKRVVVCEDEGLTIIQFVSVLAKTGLEVAGIAVTGKEAVDLVLQERPDFVIMDINMPALNGIEAVRRILAEFQTHIIMVTAYSDAAHLEEALSAGAAGYLVKPVSSGELVDALVEVYRAA